MAACSATLFLMNSTNANLALIWTLFAVLWLVLIYCERKILLAGCWLMLVWCERKTLLAECSDQSDAVLSPSKLYIAREPCGPHGVLYLMKTRILHFSFHV